MALQVTCDEDVKSVIEMGLSHLNRVLDSCPSKDSGKCDLAKFTSCSNNSQVLSIAQRKDKVTNVENCKSLTMAVECMQDFIGSCDVPGIQTTVNQTLSHMAAYYAACKTLIENEEKQKQEKEKHSNDPQASDHGENGVMQTTQSPVLIVTSGIALLLRAKFNN
ncbi:uncharacterized protein LOC131927124 isoform X2 [Physella acuta]|uniref:uncharacterized protein LOC131927124 isoform X2 n=1 Tax=Physella acuta TaxID=109671 RepID=UPI0027DAF89B|nr:uncharacterized protein LOC131927124 isoform X2 [Physella acuta]